MKRMSILFIRDVIFLCKQNRGRHHNERTRRQRRQRRQQQRRKKLDQSKLIYDTATAQLLGELFKKIQNEKTNKQNGINTNLIMKCIHCEQTMKSEWEV